MKIEEAGVSPLIRISAPEWFKETEFLDWLNSDRPIMSWHPKGQEPTEWSDTIVFVDPGLGGEGSEEGEMPDKYWDQIIEACRSQFVVSSGFHIVVVITNV